VNARTLLPVLAPLAPAATVTARLPAAFAKIARRLDVEALTLEGELAAMAEQVLAKTSSRSVLGVMNEFARMADSYRWTEDHIDVAELSLWLAQRGLEDRDRRPHRSPAQIDPELEAAICRLRKDHPRSGDHGSLSDEGGARSFSG